MREGEEGEGKGGERKGGERKGRERKGREGRRTRTPSHVWLRGCGRCPTGSGVGGRRSMLERTSGGVP